MRIRRSYTRETGVVVIRHFTHISENGNGGNGNSCGGGGEGDAHVRAKGIAVGTLSQFYSNGEAESEGHFELSGFFEKDTRSGDAVVTFDEPKPVLGLGIVIEVQDKHKDKNVLETTRAYLSKGYSVCWLSLDSFGKYSLKYGEGEFEALVRNEFPDSESVFEAELNPNGTVPRKEMYPLVASVWPDGVEVAREIQPRVDSGWYYSSYQSDGFGRVKLQAESGIELMEMNPMPERTVQLPKEWYEERARKYYRETAWEELFDPYVWDTGDVRREWGDLAKIDEFEVKMPLAKWLAEDELALVVGGLVPKSDDVIIPGYDIAPRNTTRLGKIGELMLAALVPASYVRGSELSPNDTMLISDGDGKDSIKDVKYYISKRLDWEITPWADWFPGTLELPITADIDNEPTVPKGEVPVGKWIASDGPTPQIESSLKHAFERGRRNIPESHKEKMKAKGRVQQIVEHNTGGPQPESIADHTILRTASHANISPNAVRWAIQRLVSNGVLKKTEDNRYKLTDSHSHTI